MWCPSGQVQIYGFSENILYQGDAGVAALTDHFVGPDAALNLADVGFAEEVHAEAALADAAADGAGEFAGEQALVEGDRHSLRMIHLQAHTRLQQTLLIFVICLAFLQTIDRRAHV